MSSHVVLAMPVHSAIKDISPTQLAGPHHAGPGRERLC